MALHKAAATESSRVKMAASAWDDAFPEIHALMYETMSAVSLISVAEEVIQRLEPEGIGNARPN